LKSNRTVEAGKLLRLPASTLCFPLITDRQRELESRIREAASELRLDFRETRGSDGSLFLDCDLSATPAEIAGVSRQLLSRVFGMSEDARLAFESDAAM
jgi:hypothetical protein